MKASFVPSEKVSEILPKIEHVAIFPTINLPKYLDSSRFIVDDLNFPILVKMLWTVVCGGYKTIDLQIEIRHSLWNLFRRLQYKDRNKKSKEWTKAAETLQSKIAQVAVTFSDLQCTRNLSMRKHH